MSIRQHVLVLRPEPDATRTGEALLQRSHAPVIAPLFTIVATGKPCPKDAYVALIITSVNAAQYLDQPRNLPVLTVGSHSAEAASKRGFADVRISESARRGLPQLALATLPMGSKLLAVLGEDRYDDWLQELRDNGFSVDIWTAYRSEAVRTLPKKAVMALNGQHQLAALHFSARSAEVFIALAQKSGLQAKAEAVRHIVISQDAAQPLRNAGLRDIAIAAQPRLAALIDALESQQAFTLDNQANTRKDQAKTHAQDQLHNFAASGLDTKTVQEMIGVTPVDDIQGKQAKSGKEDKTSKLPKFTTVADGPAQPAQLDDATSVSEENISQETTTQSEAYKAPEPQASPAIIASPRNGPGWGGLILSGLLGGVIGAGGLFVAQQYLGNAASKNAVSNPAPAQQSAYEGRIVALEKATAAFVPRAEMQALTLRANEAADLATKSRSELSDITARLAAGGAASGAAAPAAADIQALTGRVQRAEAASLQANQAVQAALPRLAGLETSTRNIGSPSTQAAAAVQLLLSERIRLALDAGKPFADYLKALDSSGIAAAAVQPLQAIAEKGAATTGLLRDELRHKRRVMSEDVAGQPSSWSDQVFAMAARIVTVQKLDGATSTTPSALVQRMNAALQTGDIKSALTSWKTLPEPARRGSETLGNLLEQRVAADAAVEAISEAAVKAMTMPIGSPVVSPPLSPVPATR